MSSWRRQVQLYTFVFAYFGIAVVAILDVADAIALAAAPSISCEERK